jgi:hypothetical protein
MQQIISYLERKSMTGINTSNHVFPSTVNSDSSIEEEIQYRITLGNEAY